MSEPREGARRIFEQLRALGELDVGRGWKKLVSNRLGHDANFIGRALRNGALRVDDLIGALEALEVEPRDFFAETFGAGPPRDPMSQLRERAQGSSPKIPPVLRRLEDRLLLSKIRIEGCDEAMQGQIDDFEDLRFLDPVTGAGMAEAAISNLLEAEEELSDAAGLKLLAEWGSAKRKIDRYDEALWAVLTAFRHTPCDHYRLLGDLQQRLAYCYTDHFADYRGALRLTDEALVIHAMAGNLVGMGRSIIDRAGWLYYLRPSMSQNIAANRTALSSCCRLRKQGYRFSGHINLALAYQALRPRSSDSLDRSSARLGMLDPGSPSLWSNAVWLEGSHGGGIWRPTRAS